jgi:hypothetical protein
MFATQYLLTHWGRGSAVIKVREPEYSVVLPSLGSLPLTNTQQTNSVESFSSSIIVNMIIIIWVIQMTWPGPMENEPSMLELNYNSSRSNSNTQKENTSHLYQIIIIIIIHIPYFTAV